jgi:uncharacterized membrane protein
MKTPKREELEAALAKAEAILAKAETDLDKAESTLEKAALDPANHTDAMEKARGICRRARTDRHHAQHRCDQLRSALAELKQASAAADSAEGPAKSAEVNTGAFEHHASPQVPDRGANPGPAQQPERPAGKAEQSSEQASQGKATAGAPAPPRRKYLAPADAVEWHLMARRAVMLLGLILAYLQYYFIDVQLRILHLPSVAPFA